MVILLLAGLPFALLAPLAGPDRAAGCPHDRFVAQQPDVGGFAPDLLRVQRGETVRLRLNSTDVVHGFEVPDLDIQAPDIYPGKVVEVVFTAQEAGRFPFTCTRRCSAGHWRMRGVIEVADSAGAQALTTPELPLYLKMDVDPDAMPALDPAVKESLAALVSVPSSSRGAELKQPLPSQAAAVEARHQIPELVTQPERCRALGSGGICAAPGCD